MKNSSLPIALPVGVNRSGDLCIPRVEVSSLTPLDRGQLVPGSSFGDLT